MATTVKYLTEDKVMTLNKDETLLELCLRHRIPISHACEGMASCGTCRVIIHEGVEGLPERNELEQDMALDRQFQKKERLACQICPRRMMSFSLPEDNL